MWPNLEPLTSQNPRQENWPPSNHFVNQSHQWQRIVRVNAIITNPKPNTQWICTSSFNHNVPVCSTPAYLRNATPLSHLHYEPSSTCVNPEMWSHPQHSPSRPKPTLDMKPNREFTHPHHWTIKCEFLASPEAPAFLVATVKPVKFK